MLQRARCENGACFFMNLLRFFQVTIATTCVNGCHPHQHSDFLVYAEPLKPEASYAFETSED